MCVSLTRADSVKDLSWSEITDSELFGSGRSCVGLSFDAVHAAARWGDHIGLKTKCERSIRVCRGRLALQSYALLLVLRLLRSNDVLDMRLLRDSLHSAAEELV